MSSAKRGYVRPSIRHKAGPQRRALEDAGAGVIYEEGHKGETLDGLVRSLRRGDTVLVATLARLALDRASLRIVVTDILKRGATILEVTTGRRLVEACSDSSQMLLDAVDELAQDRRAFSSKEATKAALEKWKKVEAERSRTPKHVAILIWRDTENFPTDDDAIAHPDMAGWTKWSARRLLAKKRYPTRPGGRPKKPKA